MNNEEARAYIRHLRIKRLHLTQAEAAKALGIGARTYHRLEQGTTPIKYLHILAMDQLCLLKKNGTDLSTLPSKGGTDGNAV